MLRRKNARPKRVVHWNEPVATRIAAQRSPYLYRAFRDDNPTPEQRAHMYPGSMWRVEETHALFVENDYNSKYNSPSPVPYLEAWNVRDRTHEKVAGGEPKDFVIYVGPYRVEEQSGPRHGDTIRVVRHQFLVGGRPFLLRTLEGLEPVV